LAAGLLVVLGGAAAWLSLPRAPATAAAGVTLAVYTGTVQLARSGSAATVAAHGGDQLGTGDRVATGPGTKARLVFSTGDQVRLDSGTVVVIARDDASGTVLQLLAGKTWSRVLAGAHTRHVVEAAGRQVVAGGSGSEFSVGLLAAGGPVVDVFGGTASAGGATARTGEQLRLGSTGSATVQVLPGSTRDDPWPVLNLALDLVPTPAGPAAVGNGMLLPGEQSAAQQAVSVPPSAAAADLVFTAGWGSGNLELVVLDPDGKVAGGGSGPPPITVTVPRARPGGWQYRLRNLDSSGGATIWFVLVSVVTTSQP
jgi:FecR protein